MSSSSRNGCTACPNALIETGAQRLARAEVETHDLAGLHGPRVYRDLERIGLNAGAPSGSAIRTE